MKITFLLFTIIVFAIIKINAQDTIHVSLDYPTIQAGINAANNGDIVLVEDGTYTENINFRGKAITVASRFLVDSLESHIENTIIDGSQPSYPDSGSVVTFNSGEDTTSILCGFTITGGTGTYAPSNPPALPMSYRSGGGVLCSMSGPYIINNIIIGNECIINLTDAFAAGGGISVEPPGYNSFVVIEKNNIINNLTWAQGNATAWYAGWAQGGGIALFTDGLVNNNEILLNHCKSEYGYSAGGGIRLMGGTTTIFDNQIDQNGSISNSSLGFAGGISCSAANTTIDSNKITNNYIAGASECYGAAIYLDLDSDAYWAIVKNNYISDNYHTNGICYGGAIGMYTSSPGIYNNIIAFNSADYGGALHAFDNSKPKVINNSISNNNATQAGGSLFAENYTSRVFLMNTILWNNNASGTGNEINLNTGSSISVAYCDIQGGWSGEGNIDVDPIFADTLFHLSDSSKCIGRGTASYNFAGITLNAPEYDFDGNRRPNPVGSMPDIGACENPYANPVGVVDYSNESLSEYNLSQNFPNPYNPITTISWQLPVGSNTTLKVFSILGKEVATLVNEYRQAGKYDIEFNAANLPSGVYFYRLQAGDFVQTRKMILLK